MSGEVVRGLTVPADALAVLRGAAEDPQIVAMRRVAARTDAELLAASAVYDAASSWPGNATVDRLRAAYLRGI